MAESADTTFRVVLNTEGQYSIWPADREEPLGWKVLDKMGTQAECIEYIKGLQPATGPTA